MEIQKYVPLDLIESKIKLGTSIDVTSFIQMISILFELNSIPRGLDIHILFKSNYI